MRIAFSARSFSFFVEKSSQLPQNHHLSLYSTLAGTRAAQGHAQQLEDNALDNSVEKLTPARNIASQPEAKRVVMVGSSATTTAQALRT
jgi:hypothetical protein